MRFQVWYAAVQGQPNPEEIEADGFTLSNLSGDGYPSLLFYRKTAHGRENVAAFTGRHWWRVTPIEGESGG